jgi:hypothetical protein
VQEIDPASEYVPSVHVMHVKILVAPSVSEKLPAEHLIHESTDVPAVSKYVPLGHPIHDDAPDSEYVPAVHVMQI